MEITKINQIEIYVLAVGIVTICGGILIYLESQLKEINHSFPMIHNIVVLALQSAKIYIQNISKDITQRFYLEGSATLTKIVAIWLS